MNRCENCEYFDSLGIYEGAGQDFGHCRRYPPQLIAVAPMIIFNDLEPRTSTFPTVVVSDWCGEWKEYDDGK